MRGSPSFEDIFAVMSAASVGDTSARVALPDPCTSGDLPTRFAIALNVLLDELSFRADARRQSLEDERRASHALRQSEARKAAIVETALDGVVSIDAEGRVAEWNASATRIFGFTRAEALGGSLADLIIPSHLRDAHRAGLMRYLETGDARVLGRRLELTALRKDGATFPVELAIARVGSTEPATFTGYIRDISERKEAMASLRASEERHRAMFESSPMPMWVHDAATFAFLAVNGAAVRHYGYSREELGALAVTALGPPEAFAATDMLEYGVGRLSSLRRKDGSFVDVEVRTHDIELQGRPARLVLANDVTERRRLEEQLRQAQKMEAVGRLAGGVAHDFNNLLLVILGYSESLLADSAPGAAARGEIEEIRDAGLRAAELTRQLLMFSRQQVIEPRILDLNQLLSNMDKMLHRVVSANVEIVSRPSAPLGMVRADAGSLEQVIMNLVVNAHDAMPGGGELLLETSPVSLDEAGAQRLVGARPGPHVRLTVSDTGVGMDEATLARVFEPFFTTKERGKGTGLGLSTVFGIVKQSGGSISVHSEPGKGARFDIYLPVVEGARQDARATIVPSLARGSETVLLVEDEDQVRAVARRTLERQGYRVIEAINGREGLRVAGERAATIDLLVSDVVMPEMGGPDLARHLAARWPDVRILLMSGYADDTVVRQGISVGQVAFLQKPFTAHELLVKVREVLDAPWPAHRASGSAASAAPSAPDAQGPVSSEGSPPSTGGKPITT